MMQKELDRYLLPVFRKKYKTDRRLKKYPPKVVRFNFIVKVMRLLDFLGWRRLQYNFTILILFIFINLNETEKKRNDF